jgi:hypothetical protein
MIVAVACASCGSSSAKTDAANHAPRPTGYPQPEHIIPLLTTDNPKLEETAALMAAAGNDREKKVASVQLVREAEFIASDDWRARQEPMMRRMTATRVLTRGEEIRWIDDWQKRHLVRVYDAMKQLGGDTLLAHCRSVAKSDERRGIHRQLALAVLASFDEVSHGPPKRDNAWGMPGASDPLTGPGQTTYAGPPTGGTDPQRKRPQDATTPTIRAPRVEGGKIINVNEVIDALLPYFKVCYERSLAINGRFGAWVILVATVNGAGQVVNVTGKGDEGMPHDFMQCLRSVTVQARFAPPQGGDATVSLELAFTVPATYRPSTAGQPGATNRGRQN